MLYPETLGNWAENLDYSKASGYMLSCFLMIPSLSCLQDYAVNSWKSPGAPAEKLIVVFGAYAHTFTLTNPANHGLDAPTSGLGTAGPYTQEAGTLAYLEVMSSEGLEDPLSLFSRLKICQWRESLYSDFQ